MGKGPSLDVNGASPCSWKQAVAVDILQGVREKKKDSFRGFVSGENQKVANGWCGAGIGALLSTERREGAGILNHHYHFQEHGHLQL